MTDVLEPVMATRDAFCDDSQLLDYLADQLIAGRLALILGAGVSKPMGLPKWPQLIDRLFATQKETPPVGKSLPQQAEYFRSKYCDNDTRKYLDLIHNALYQGANLSFEGLEANRGLSAIGSLLMTSLRGSIAEVVTFNFDDVLERFLRYHGFVTVPVFRRRRWVQHCDVTVFHPHGFLPFDITEASSEDIIMDQYSFSETIADDSDVWRQRLLRIMSTRTCLFVGLSGTDGNFDKTLIACEKLHAYRLQNTAFLGITFSTEHDTAARALWERRKVFYKVISDYEEALPDFLFGICQRAAKSRLAN